MKVRTAKRRLYRRIVATACRFYDYLPRTAAVADYLGVNRVVDRVAAENRPAWKKYNKTGLWRVK